MTARAPISAYIRTKNEERMIADVIRAAQQVVSEVVIVDSGSTDKTLQIADSLGARVIKSAWLGGGKQKRIAEDAARHNWLLDLDADEVVTEELADEIGALFEHGAPDAPVYKVLLATAPPVGPAWRDFYLRPRYKLYDRRVLRQPDHANWDQLEVPDELRIGKLHAPLIHYSFRDLAQLEDKFNRNTTGRANDTKLKPFWIAALRMVFARPFYFLNHYIRRGMWRGGWYGFAVASIAAHGRWLKDAKMVEIHLRNRDAKTD
jgi:glycosyltransferase involved in cell wall biosynthesis